MIVLHVNVHFIICNDETIKILDFSLTRNSNGSLAQHLWPGIDNSAMIPGFLSMHLFGCHSPVTFLLVSTHKAILNDSSTFNRHLNDDEHICTYIHVFFWGQHPFDGFKSRCLLVPNPSAEDQRSSRCPPPHGSVKASEKRACNEKGLEAQSCESSS